MGTCKRQRWIAMLTLAGALVLPQAAQATSYPQPPTSFEPVLEAQNFAITQQRQTVYDTPEYQAQLAADSAANATEALAAQAADPGRFFTNNLCWNRGNGCAGDIRLYNWTANGYGIVRPCCSPRATAPRSPGTSGRPQPARRRRPGVVITNGSVQADEQMYWYAAQALAKAGYVVLTFDPQGQGQSDTLGAGARRSRGRARPERRPALLRRHRGRDRLLPLEPQAPLSAGRRAAKPGPATPPSRPNASRPASTPPTTRSGSCSTRPGSASPDTPTARRASPTSRSGTRA